MEPVLLFETSPAFEDSAVEDKIRQCIIDMEMDPPGPEEASTVMSGIFSYVETNVLSSSLLIDVASLVFQCFDKYSSDLLPIFEKFWRQGQNTLGTLVCKVSAASAFARSSAIGSLKGEVVSFLQSVLKSCEEKPMKPMGCEIPAEMENEFLWYVLLGVDLTKEQLETFWPRLNGELPATMIDRLVRHIFDLKLIDYLPAGFFKKHGILGRLSTELLVELLKHTPTETMKQMLNWWSNCVSDRNDGDLTNAFLLKCRSDGIKIKRRFVSKIAKSLRPEHVTDELFEILKDNGVVMPAALLDGFAELPKPEVVMTLFPDARDRLSQKDIDELLEKTTDWDMLDRWFSVPIDSPVLRSTSFWLRIMRDWPENRPPPNKLSLAFKDHASGNWEIVRSMIFDVFPPPERACRVMSALFFGEDGGPGACPCLTKERTLEILNALTEKFEGDVVRMPCYSFWSLVSDTDALFELITISKYSAVFLEEYAYKLLSASLASRLTDFDFKEQTEESLAEVAAYAKDTKSNWYVSQCTMSLRALSFIAHAHLFFVVCVVIDAQSITLMKEKVLSKLTPETYFYFAACLCRIDKPEAGNSRYLDAVLNNLDQDMLVKAIRLSITDKRVQAMMHLCIEHWQPMSYKYMADGGLSWMPFFGELCSVLVSGEYSEDRKILVEFMLETMSACTSISSGSRRHRNDREWLAALGDPQIKFIRWLIDCPDLWPSEEIRSRTRFVIVKTDDASKMFSIMAEEEETAKKLAQFCLAFDVEPRKLDITKPAALLKGLAEAEENKDWKLMYVFVRLLLLTKYKEELRPWVEKDLPTAVKCSLAGAISPSELTAKFFVSLFRDFDIQSDASIRRLPFWRELMSDIQHEASTGAKCFQLLSRALHSPAMIRYRLQFDLEGCQWRLYGTKQLFAKAFSDVKKEDIDAMADAFEAMYMAGPEPDLFVRRPVIGELPPVPELGTTIVDGLLGLEPATASAFYSLSQFAMFFPYFIRDKMAAILFVHKHISTIFAEYYGGQQKDVDMNALSLGAYAVIFLHYVLHSAEAMDIFIPWFFENVMTFTSSQVLAYLMILNSHYAVSGLQHVMTGVFMKHSLPDVSNQLLSKDFENSAMHRHIQEQIFNLDLTFYACLNAFGLAGAISADEISQSEKPFQEAFDDTWMILKLELRQPPFKMLSLRPAIPDELEKSIQNLVMNFKLSTDKLDIGLRRVSDLSEQVFRNREETFEPYKGPVLGGVDRDALMQLPRAWQAKILNTMVPNLENLCSSAIRMIVHQPAWIADWLSRKALSPGRARRVLMPEHYEILLPLVSQLLESQSAAEEEPTVDDITLLFYCQDSYFSKLVEEFMAIPKHEKVPLSLCLLFKKLASKTSLFSILEAINQVLATPLTSRALKRLLGLLELMSNTQCFNNNFCDVCAPVVLEKVCLPEYRSSATILTSAARLFLPIVNELPNKVVHMTIFMLQNQKIKQVGVALDLFKASSETRKEYIMPYVQIAFDQALEKGSKDTTMFLTKVPEVAQARHPQMIALLRRLLSNFDRSSVDLVGSLFSALAPVRDFSQSIRLSDSLSIDASSPSAMRSLPIPLTIRQQAPEFWEVFAEYRKFINDMVHNDTSLLRGSFKFLLQYPEIIDFKVRVAMFQDSMRRRLNGPTLNVSVRRQSILIDSFNRLTHVKPSGLMAPIHVRFLGEEGYDAGGVRRDWFTCLTKELFNQNYALFMATPGGRSHQPNPASYVNQDHIAYFTFAGRIMARALVEGVNLDAHLTTAFCKHILQLPLTLRDLETVDESLHQSLKWILENEFDPEDLDMHFTADNEYMGRHETIDLKPNGSNILVTNQNKEEYVALIVEQRLKKLISAQINAFCAGFYSVIPHEDIRSFTPNELDLLICGVPEIDVEDMKRNCHYAHPYSENHPVVKTFFEVISKWNNESLAKLLLFMTGSSQVPIEGFRYFAMIDQPITIAPGGERGRLPVAHTCMNTIDVPEYTDVDELDAKLSFAVNNCDSFGII